MTQFRASSQLNVSASCRGGTRNRIHTATTQKLSPNLFRLFCGVAKKSIPFDIRHQVQCPLLPGSLLCLPVHISLHSLQQFITHPLRHIVTSTIVTKIKHHNHLTRPFPVFSFQSHTSLVDRGVFSVQRMLLVIDVIAGIVELHDHRCPTPLLIFFNSSAR